MKYSHASTRRTFLKRSAMATSLVAVPWIIPATARGADGALPPSDRVTVALIGKGLMGNGHLHRLAGDKAFQLIGVSDADRTRCEDGAKQVDQFYAADRASGVYSGCKACPDYRELLVRKDLDAVLIATPDHWHTQQSIDAAKAGKDVYCEKPVALTIHEGRQLADTMRVYSRVFQTGTQYRSIPTIRLVCDFIRHGGLGRVKSVFTPWGSLSGFIHTPRFKPYADWMNYEKASTSMVPLLFDLPAEPVPEGLNWNQWLGPASWHPYNPLYHSNNPNPGLVPWSFCEDFGLAASTWYHSHAADVIQYALGMETSGPVEIIHPSSGEFPSLTCKYANGTLLHFVEHWGIVKEVYKAVPVGTRLEGNFGGLFIGERGWVTSMSAAGPIEGGPDSLFEEMKLANREVNIGANNHHANWLECIRTRQQPSSHAEIGHRSASLGQLAIIAYKLGRSLRWDPVKEEFPGDAEANRLRARTPRPPWQI